MTRTRYEVLLQRYRIMMVESGVLKRSVTNAELLQSLKATTHEEQIKTMEAILSLVPESYWQAREAGLPPIIDLSRE